MMHPNQRRMHNVRVCQQRDRLRILDADHFARPRRRLTEKGTNPPPHPLCTPRIPRARLLGVGACDAKKKRQAMSCETLNAP